jgi:hypothetical protein
LAGFARFCQAYGIRPGIGRTKVCWDTAAAESAFADPKNEMNCRQAFRDRVRALDSAYGRRPAPQQTVVHPIPVASTELHDLGECG